MNNHDIISRTDFKTWDRTTLEQFAREAADEILSLEADRKIILAAWREAVKSIEVLNDKHESSPQGGAALQQQPGAQGIQQI